VICEFCMVCWIMPKLLKQNDSSLESVATRITRRPHELIEDPPRVNYQAAIQNRGQIFHFHVADNWLAASIVTLVLVWMAAAVHADVIPLPSWYLYGGGNGSTWDGSSTSPDNLQLSVTLTPPPMPNQYGTAVAASSADVLQIAPSTSYALTFSASLSGLGGSAALTVDNVGTIKQAAISGSTWKRYTNSFTTGDSSDPHVGRNLNIQFIVSQFGGSGSSSISVTNIQLQTLQPPPTLLCRKASPTIVQLLWPTNYPAYIPQQSTTLQTGSWQDITSTPVTLGNQFVLQLNIDATKRFFRLRGP